MNTKDVSNGIQKHANFSVTVRLCGGGGILLEKIYALFLAYFRSAIRSRIFAALIKPPFRVSLRYTR